ncbi:PREDICTED: trypsin-2-like [Nicrophorus vespilloides]|uniref:Trypsin-2-like n=1 Tax=Nicrophorus vespilloides TaxID=110193 RepID=A0ABM1MH42_NICVS|nr:PREDICTED: trypsin-2-like [Nicrophorus vespilloides]
MIKFVVLALAVAVASATPKMLPRLDGRIVGGKETTIEQYPYQLSLQYYGSHICGASIISNKYVVTAAHCTDGSSASSLSIRAGSSIRNSGGVVIAVKKIHQNPKYNSRTIDYDISVMELVSPLSFGSGIQTVSLPKNGEAATVGADAICTGWGTTSEGGSLPSKLQTVTVKVVSTKECSDAYGVGEITDRMICAGVGGGKDACQGDSGGPLVSGGKLVGIVSWGYGCARPSHPGVYSRVSNLREYITQTAGI